MYQYVYLGPIFALEHNNFYDGGVQQSKRVGKSSSIRVFAPRGAFN